MKDAVIAHQTPNGEIFVLAGTQVQQVRSVPYNVFLYELGERKIQIPSILIPQGALKKGLVPSKK